MTVTFKENYKGDGLKTQRSIMKVVDNAKYVPVEENTVVSENVFRFIQV